MEAAVPQDESDEAREGTAAHWVAQAAVLGFPVPPVDAIAANGVVVDQAMIDGATVYAEYIRSVLGHVPARVEQRTAPGGIHPKCWGTPDADDTDNGTLHIFDYKYGHRHVEAFENPQLTCYAADRLHASGLPAIAYVMFHIIQPRCFHADGPISSWNCPVGKLYDMIAHLQSCAAAAIRPDAPLVATPGNCRDCDARTRCPAAQAAAIDAAEFSRAAVPFDLSNAEAARFLSMVRQAQGRLDAMATGLEEQLLQALRSGRFVSGWQLTQTRSREQWRVPVEHVISMGRALGKDLGKLDAVTPSQARKLGIDETVISAYAFRPSGEMKLAPIDTTLAKKVFAK
jgi:hypothetical protein